jgi:chemotaxis methyl-accepting protein methylase
MKSHAYHINDIFFSLEGMDIAQYDETFLINSANRRCIATKCETIEDYLELLENSELERMTFFDNLQIGYSSFFRNPLTFYTLEKVVLPDLITKIKNSKSKDLRIWSAACASGQEAYSIAMLIEEEVSCNENEKCNCLIFATDKDEEQIEMAYRGQYARHALDNISLKQLDKWFIKYGNTFFVKPELKEKISFSVLDLFDRNYSSPPTSIFGHFDIVLCANLLFYYKENHRKIILEKITGAMSENGYLVTGETERDILKKYHFREVYPHSAIFRRG